MDQAVGKLERVAQRLLRVLALADVADDEADFRRALGVLREGGREMHPDRSHVDLQQAQLAGLRVAADQQPLARLIKNVLVRRQDEAGNRPLDQRAAAHSEQVGGAEIDLPDHSRLAEGEIADRSQLVQVEVARAAGAQFRLRPPQLLVLQLQLDLMDPEFMQHLLHLLERKPRELSLRAGAPFPGEGLGPPAQGVCGACRSGGICGGWILVGHRVFHTNTGRSVVATA